MIFFFIFLLIVVALPVGAILVQVKFANYLSRATNRIARYTALAGTSILISLCWFAVCLPIGYVFVLGIPGSHGQPVTWLVAEKIFNNYLVLPFITNVACDAFPELRAMLGPQGCEILGLLQLPFVILVIGSVA